MANFGTTFKALNKAVQVGLQAATEKVRKGRFSAAGKPIRCPHCEHDLFIENPSGVGLLIRGLSDASVLVCARCARIQIFMRRAEALTPPPASAETQAQPQPQPQTQSDSSPQAESNPTQDEREVSQRPEDGN